jgi:hypothetical protein
MAEGTLSSSARPETAPPASVDLRPLTTSELIDRGFSLYRAHFAGFLLLSILAQTAPLLSQLLITAFQLMPTDTELLENTPKGLVHMASVLGISFVAQAIVFCFNTALTFYIADAWKIPSVTASLHKFTTCLVPAIWTCLLIRVLVGLTLLLPGAVLAGAYVYALDYHPFDFEPLLIFGIISISLLIVSLVPVLIVFMRLWVTVPPLALEGLSGWKAVRRSTALVRFDPGLGVFYWGEMRLSFLLLPLFVIGLLIFSLTSLPLIFFYFSEAIRHGANGQIPLPPDATMIFSQILNFLAGSLIWPLYAIATTLFYYDVRIRREGFDLEFMAGRLRGAK